MQWSRQSATLSTDCRLHRADRVIQAGTQAFGERLLQPWHGLQGKRRTSIARFADLHEAIRLNPADAFCNRGFSYYSKQELDRAIMDFDEAIRIDPEMTEAFYGRGLARSAMGAHEEAIADFDKVVRRDLEMQARSISAAIPTPKRGAGSRD